MDTSELIAKLQRLEGYAAGQGNDERALTPVEEEQRAAYEQTAREVRPACYAILEAMLKSGMLFCVVNTGPRLALPDVELGTDGTRLSLLWQMRGKSRGHRKK